jgi:hypothetical protein
MPSIRRLRRLQKVNSLSDVATHTINQLERIGTTSISPSPALNPSKIPTLSKKTLILKLNLRTWFPPNDPFASHVARLCILREDFVLGMAGISTEQIDIFDGNHPVWRKLYFWRNLVRTLYEIRNTLRRIEALDEFKQIFDSQSSQWRRKFKLAIKKLEEDKDLIDDTRNSVGGHVQQHTVDQALNNLPRDLF